MDLALLPLSVLAIELLSTDRSAFERATGIALCAEWPHASLREVLPAIAATTSVEAPVAYAIVDRARSTPDGRALLVGDVGFHGKPSADGTIEIGYSVLVAERRKGIATWALRALLEVARDRDDVRTVVAGCDADNDASIGVLRACGFESTGSDGESIRWTSRSLEPA